MTYSVDLRARVVSYVRGGGSQSSACRIFKVSLWCVRDWCGRADLQPKRYSRSKPGKLDMEALRQDIAAHPDALLRERAAKFGVRPPAIFYACRRMGISHKKNAAL